MTVAEPVSSLRRTPARWNSPVRPNSPGRPAVPATYPDSWAGQAADPESVSSDAVVPDAVAASVSTEEDVRGWGAAVHPVRRAAACPVHTEASDAVAGGVGEAAG